MRVLFIGAHTDDIEHGAGGTLVKALRAKHDVSWVCMSDCADLERNQGIEEDITRVREAIGTLGGHTFVDLFDNRRMHEQLAGIRQLLEGYLDPRPDIVFTHWTEDVHQDHAAVAAETLRVFKEQTVLMYQCMRSCPGFAPDYFVELSEEHLMGKLRLLGMYKTQERMYYNSPRLLESLALVRGAEACTGLAEGFKVKYVRGGHRL